MLADRATPFDERFGDLEELDEPRSDWGDNDIATASPVRPPKSEAR
jgi:hypothetical protein